MFAVDAATGKDGRKNNIPKTGHVFLFCEKNITRFVYLAVIQTEIQVNWKPGIFILEKRRAKKRVKNVLCSSSKKNK